eukprot:213513_1
MKPSFVVAHIASRVAVMRVKIVQRPMYRTVSHCALIVQFPFCALLSSSLCARIRIASRECLIQFSIVPRRRYNHVNLRRILPCVECWTVDGGVSHHQTYTIRKLQIHTKQITYRLFILR